LDSDPPPIEIDPERLPLWVLKVSRWKVGVGTSAVKLPLIEPTSVNMDLGQATEHESPL
jgi:hypothetical protein